MYYNIYWNIHKYFFKSCLERDEKVERERVLSWMDEKRFLKVFNIEKLFDDFESDKKNWVHRF